MSPIEWSPAGRRIVPWVLGALVVVALLGVGFGHWWGRPAAAPQEPIEALSLILDRALNRGPAAVAGLALRPLAAASASPDEAAAADALCAAIADRLARLAALRVVPCRSTAAAVAAQLDDQRLARLLAVGHVMTGSLRVSEGGRWQVHLELRRAADGAELWQLDEVLAEGDLPGIPPRVTQGVGAALALAAPGAVEPVAAPELNAKYLRARMLGRQVALEDRRAALRLLDEVLAAEPDHVPSLFLRQNLRGYLLGNLDDGKRHASVDELNAARAANVEQGLALARQIVARDPADLRGQWLLLGHEIETRQWAAGFDRVDAMLRVAGRDAGLMRLAARLHLHAGYVTRANALALEAARLNALDAEAIEILALVAGIERRDDTLREMIAVARQIGHQGMGRAEVFDAFRRQDWQTLERVHSAWVAWGDKWPADWVPSFVRGLSDPAQRETAAQVLDGHDAATRQHFVSYFIEYALLGDTRRSLRAVQHHAKLPPATWMQHLWWPELTEVRRQPGFIEAVDDLGMTRLWAVRGAPDRCHKDSAAGWTCD